MRFLSMWLYTSIGILLFIIIIIQLRKKTGQKHKIDKNPPIYGTLCCTFYRVSKLSRGTLCNPSYIKFFVIIFLNINCNVY